MENKKFLLFAIGLASIIFVIALWNSKLILADDTFSCSPTVQIVNQDPVIAEPGSYVNVVLEVSGLNSYCGNGFAVNLVPQYPFSLDTDTNPMQILQNSPYSEGFKTSWTVAYKIRVADDALQQAYPLKLLYHTGTSTDFSSFALEKDFNISVNNVQTDFAVVLQSTSGTQASLGIVNIGKNAANSMIVGIPTQDNFRASGTSQQIVGNLAAGDYTVASFNLASSRGSATNATGAGRTAGTTGTGQNFIQSATPRTLKVQIDYTDSIGVRRSVTKEIPFSVSSTSLATGAITGRAVYGRSSGISVWIFVGIGVLVLSGGFIFYKKYRKKKKSNEKNSEVPDWVLAEKKSKK